MKLLTALLLLASLNGGAQDRTVYFPEVRENYNIYHPMIIKDTSKSIWVDSLTMLKLKGEYKVVDSFKFGRYTMPRKVIDTTIFKSHLKRQKVKPDTVLPYSIWPQFVDSWVDVHETGFWATNWRLPCGTIKTLGDVKKKFVRINFSKHCARCKDVFPDRIYFAYESNLQMSNK